MSHTTYAISGIEMPHICDGGAVHPQRALGWRAVYSACRQSIERTQGRGRGCDMTVVSIVVTATCRCGFSSRTSPATSLMALFDDFDEMYDYVALMVCIMTASAERADHPSAAARGHLSEVHGQEAWHVV